MVLPVQNRYLGQTVTVAGLLSARDIIAAAKEARLPKEAILCIPDICLRDGTEILIDDGALTEIAVSTGVKTIVVPSSAREFWFWLKDVSDESPLKEVSA